MPENRWSNRTRQAPFPPTTTLTLDYIVKCGEKLVRDFYAERKGGIGKIFIMSLSFHNLERSEKGQQGITGFLGGSNAHRMRSQSLPPAPADITSRKRRAESAFVDLTSADTSDVEADVPILSDGQSDDDDLIEVPPAGPVFTCKRCKAIIGIRQEAGEVFKEAESRIEAKHSAWHEKQDAARSTEIVMKKKKKMRKGQQKLNGWFTKA